jgi:hypothetical protein
MIDPVDFYRLAESLLSWPSAREEHYRTAISRAYYAAFLAWRGFAVSSDRMILKTQTSPLLGTGRRSVMVAQRG